MHCFQASLTSDRPAATSKDANIDGAPIDDDVDGEALDGQLHVVLCVCDGEW